MIAVLGATGYVGGSLARALAGHGEALTLFARKPEVLARQPWEETVALASLDDFDASEFDLVINAIGAGDAARIGAMGAELLEVTATWDRRVLSSLRPEAGYVFLSSGAVYGTFDEPADDGSTFALPVNRLDRVPPYVLAKWMAEAVHRHRPNRAIFDLRIFGYADPSIPLQSRFFLAELARSVVTGTPFVTSSADMIRDYADAAELAALIACWRRAGMPNMAADLRSRAPVAKDDLLTEASERYGIAIVRRDDAEANPTGAKPIYASHWNAAARLGHDPERSSLQIVIEALDAIRAAQPPI